MKESVRLSKIAVLRDRDGPGCFLAFPGCRHVAYIPDAEVTFDHFHPKSRGGTWKIENMRLACRPCNNKKADRVPGLDGSIPPPPARQQRRATKRALVRPELCTICHTARLLSGEEVCWACGRHALPQHRDQRYKRRTWECDHSETWCISCCLMTPAEKHAMLAQKYATLGVVPEDEAVAG